MKINIHTNAFGSIICLNLILSTSESLVTFDALKKYIECDDIHSVDKKIAENMLKEIEHLIENS